MERGKEKNSTAEMTEHQVTSQMSPRSLLLSEICCFHGTEGLEDLCAQSSKSFFWVKTYRNAGRSIIIAHQFLVLSFKSTGSVRHCSNYTENVSKILNK